MELLTLYVVNSDLDAVTSAITSMHELGCASIFTSIASVIMSNPWLTEAPRSSPTHDLQEDTASASGPVISLTFQRNQILLRALGEDRNFKAHEDQLVAQWWEQAWWSNLPSPAQPSVVSPAVSPAPAQPPPAVGAAAQPSPAHIQATP